MEHIDNSRVTSIESGPDKSALIESGFINLFESLHIPSEMKLKRVLFKVRTAMLTDQATLLRSLGLLSTHFLPIFHSIYLRFSRLPKSKRTYFHSDWVMAKIDL